MQASRLLQQAKQQASMGNYSHAETLLLQAIEVDKADPELYYELGNLRLESANPSGALDGFLSALKLAPGHPQILLQLGNTQMALGQHQDGVEYFRQSFDAEASPAAAYNLGNALRELGKPQEAEQWYRTALRLAPRDADTHNNLGNVLREQGRLDEAIASYQAALQLNPGLHHALAHLVHQRQHVCDWEGLDLQISQLRQIVREQPQAQVSPFAFLSLPGTTAAEQRLCSENWSRNRFGSLMAQAARAPLIHTREAPPKLRIGYLSGDFRLHPLAFLATELFELHDRSRFEIHAYSYARDDGTPTRKRLERAFDAFHDIQPQSLQQTAQQIHADGIHILVDLTGYTQTSRSGLMALRPTPVQVNWLGFPGTMGAPFVDYLIADDVIIPPEQRQHYAETITPLPDCYQPNDSQRPVAATPTRAECGLPEQGFVFCCFNQTFKITPQLFEIWMLFLKENAGGVLWLLECNPWAKANLRRAAQQAGIAPERLVFAPRAPIAQHLARQQLADLFLDTLPYNAHTTTSDALWVGLPVLTSCGDTFASRVAASLLQAAELPQLVTHSLDEYHTKALELARHPEQLQAIRQHLQQKRDQLALFDTPRFARNLEAAYENMWKNYLAG